MAETPATITIVLEDSLNTQGQFGAERLAKMQEIILKSALLFQWRVVSMSTAQPTKDSTGG